jgi:exopolysaccharide biosynthesis polyprenyl glycosylphosphotransferase
MRNAQPLTAEIAEDGVAQALRRPLIQVRHRDRDFALRRALLAADLLGLCLSLGFALLVAGKRVAPAQDLLWILPTLPLWALVFWTYRLYGRPVRRLEPTHLDDVPSLFHALVMGTLGLWFFYKVAPVPKLEFAELAVFGLVALPLIAALRIALRVISLRAQGPERVFVVAPADDVRLMRRKLRNHPEYGMELVGSVAEEACEELGLPLQAELPELEALLATRQIDHLVARLDADYLPQERLVSLMRLCHREGIRFGFFPGDRGLLSPSTEINHLEGMGIMISNPPVLPGAGRFVKRGMDVALSALLLALLAPLFGLIALLLKLDSRGPILYRQIRVGKDGRRFELLKFRTMVVGADEQVAELMKDSVDPDWLVLDADPRVTKVGRVLRRNSVDELPQLWNVLKGDMSMVGPRPLPERDDENVRGWARHRLDLIPGITGYWQVLGRNSIPFSEMLEVDYAYVAGWSLWQDLKLLIQTVPAVIRRRGAN